VRVPLRLPLLLLVQDLLLLPLLEKAEKLEKAAQQVGEVLQSRQSAMHLWLNSQLLLCAMLSHTE
jgi:hypothetical protein